MKHSHLVTIPNVHSRTQLDATLELITDACHTKMLALRGDGVEAAMARITERALAKAEKDLLVELHESRDSGDSGAMVTIRSSGSSGAGKSSKITVEVELEPARSQVGGSRPVPVVSMS